MPKKKTGKAGKPAEEETKKPVDETEDSDTDQETEDEDIDSDESAGEQEEGDGQEFNADKAPGVSDEEIAQQEIDDETDGEEEDLEDKLEPEVELVVENAVVKAKVWPRIIGGVCEFCGGEIMNPEKGTVVGSYRLFGYPDPNNTEDFMDYNKFGKCRHYKGEKIRCSYCRGDARRLVRRTLNVFSLPETPNKLIVVCNDYKCQKKHTERFSKAVV